MSWDKFYATASGREKDAVATLKGVCDATLPGSMENIDEALAGLEVLQRYDLIDAEDVQAKRDEILNCADTE